MSNAPGTPECSVWKNNPGLRLLQPLPIHEAVDQEKCSELKCSTAITDKEYLCQHPEIQYLIDFFLTEIIKARPKSIQKFMVELFSKPDIKELIMKRGKAEKTNPPTINKNLQPYETTDWLKVAQMSLGEDEDETSVEDEAFPEVEISG